MVMPDDAMLPFAKWFGDGVRGGENGYRDCNGDVDGHCVCPELPRQPRHRHRGSLIAELNLEPALPQPGLALGYQPSKSFQRVGKLRLIKG